MPFSEEIALWFLLIVATITDIREGKVYNLLTFPMMGLGLATRLWMGGSDAALDGLLGLFVAFAAFLPLYALGAFAAGDVKLLMAVGAWAGWRLVVHCGVFGILVGAVVGLVFLLKRNGLKTSLKSLKEHLTQLNPSQSLKMPFAPAFLCGFLLVKIAQVYQWELLV